MWRNWQTRTVQVRVGETPWRFESSHPHFPARLAKASAVPRPANGAAAPIGAPQTGGCVISPSLALRTPEDRCRGWSPMTGTEAALRGGDGPHPPPFLVR